MQIQVENLTKAFKAYKALDNVSVSVGHGELLALLGPSGCGKTTLLRIIAGLDFPDQGVIRFDGTDVQTLSAKERNVGFVFQHYALFKHMTIFDNVAFGLKVRKRKLRPSKEEIRERVMKLLGLVQLANLEDRYPHQLSGGQRQRVAIARALVTRPRMVLADEPTGNLDSRSGGEILQFMRHAVSDLHQTIVMVTHDANAAAHADRVVFLADGKIVTEMAEPTAAGVLDLMKQLGD